MISKYQGTIYLSDDDLQGALKEHAESPTKIIIIIIIKIKIIMFEDWYKLQLQKA